MVVETGCRVEYAQALPGALVAIVKTHWHLDHIGGNARLDAALSAPLAEGFAACTRWRAR